MADSDTNSSSNAEKPKRRVSWFAWLMTVIVAGCLVVMNSRGVMDVSSIQFVIDSKNQLLGPTCRFEHGWPMKWVDSERIDAPSERTLGLSKYLRETVASQLEQSWVFNTSPTSIDYTALSINSLVAVLILTVVFFVCRFRCRRRRWFKFSLLEIAIITMFVSIVLVHSKKLNREFLETLSSVFPTTESIIFGSFDSPETITWLTQQCPKLAVVNTRSFPFDFEQAMQLPTSV